MSRWITTSAKSDPMRLDPTSSNPIRHRRRLLDPTRPDPILMTLDPTRFGSNIAPAPNGIGSDVCRYRIQPHQIRYWRIVGPRPDPTNRRHWIRGGFRSDDRPLRKLSLPTGAGRKMGAEHCCVYGDPHSPGRDNASALAGRRRDGQVGHRECKSSTRRGGLRRSPNEPEPDAVESAAVPILRILSNESDAETSAG